MYEFFSRWKALITFGRLLNAGSNRWTKPPALNRSLLDLLRRATASVTMVAFVLSSCVPSGAPEKSETASLGTSQSAIVNSNRSNSGQGPRTDFEHFLAPGPADGTQSDRLFGPWCDPNDEEYADTCLKGEVPSSSAVVDGVYTHSVPIKLPAGRAGLRPSLALEYSSANRQDGPLGVGWSLGGLSAISRCTHTVATDGFAAGFDFNHDYNVALNKYCLDGNPLVPTGRSGNYVYYQTERADFTAIVGLYPSIGIGDPWSFIVTTAQGDTHFYGGDANGTSRATGPRGGAGSAIPGAPVPYAWHLSQTKSRDGNVINYSYEADPGSAYVASNSGRPRESATRYLSSITYANRKVKLVWSDRAAPVTAFTFGFDLSVHKQLARIEVYAPANESAPIWQYVLGYGTSQFTGRPLLETVELVDKYGGLAGRLPKTMFSWDRYDAPADRPALGDSRDFVTKTYGVGNVPGLTRILLADINGDGRDDVLAAGQSDRLRYLLATSTGFGAMQATQIPDLRSLSGEFTATLHLERSASADLDGDGTEEVLLYVEGGMDESERYPGSIGSYRVLKWNGSALALEQTSSLSALLSGLPTYDVPPTADDRVYRRVTPKIDVADLNGDGIFDLVAGMMKPGDPESRRFVYLGKEGSLEYANPVAGPYGDSKTVSGLEGAPIKLFTAVGGDLNGDRRADVWSTLSPNTYLTDLNGDGVADMLDLWSMRNVPCSRATLTIRAALAYSRAYAGDDFFLPSADGIAKDLSVTLTGPTPSASLDFSCGQNFDYTQTLRSGDFNGDGRDDLIALRPFGARSDGRLQFGEPNLLLSTGDGYAPIALPRVAGRVYHPSTYLDYYPVDSTGRHSFPRSAVGDVDGDGKADLVELIPRVLSSPAWYMYLDVTSLDRSKTDRRDVIVKVERALDGWGGAEQISYADLPALAAMPDPLTNTGSRYKRCTSSEGNVRCLAKGPLVVESFRPRGRGYQPKIVSEQQARIHYSYENAQEHRTRGRGFLGFAKITAWDPYVGTQTITDRSQKCDWHEVRSFHDFGLGEYAAATLMADEVFVGPFDGPWDGRGSLCYTNGVRVETLRGELLKLNKVAGTPLQRVVTATTNMLVTDVPNREGKRTYGPYLVRPIRIEVSETYIPNANTISDTKAPDIQRIEEFFDYDAYSNATRIVRSTVGGASQTLNLKYDNLSSSTSWIIGQLRQVDDTRTNTQGAITRSTAFEYFNNNRLSKTIQEPPQRVDGSPNPNQSNDTTLTTSYSYSLGNLKTVETSGYDAAISSTRTQTTTYTYDTDNVHLKTVDAGLGQTTFTFDPGLGVLLSEVDPNGVGIDYVYDGLGRRLGAFSDTGEASLSVAIHAPNFTYQIQQRTSVPSSDCPSGALTLNGKCFVVTGEIDSDQDHRFAVRRRNFDGTWNASWTLFDWEGRKVFWTTPHDYKGPGLWPELQYHAEYDGLGRPTRLQTPDGGMGHVAWTYPDAFHVEATAKTGGGKVVTTTNLDGQVVLTDELIVSGVTGSSGHASTSLAYDPFGNLVSSVRTDRDGATRSTSFGYDTLGRKTSMADAARGTQSVSYNAFGEIRKQIDALSSRTTTHDLLGRVIKVSDDADPTKYESFDWDFADNGIGKLAIARRMPDNVTRIFTYDVQGRPKDRAIDFGGRSYIITDEYDAEGRLSRRQFPTPLASEEVVATYAYNAYGLPSSITAHVGPKKTTVWTQTSGTPSRVSSSMGDGTTSEWLYETSTARATDVRVTGAGGEALLRLQYEYDTRGEVKKRTDVSQLFSDEFVHDSLGRLETWTRRGLQLQTLRREYAYNDFGDMTSAKTFNAPTGGTALGSDSYTLGYGSNPQAVRRHTDAGGSVIDYEYDALGRRTKRITGGSTTTTVFNHQDLPSSTVAAVGPGTYATTYLYDAMGQRAHKQEPNGTKTHYLDGLFEHQSVGSDHVFKHHLGPADIIQEFKTDGAGNLAGSVATAFDYVHTDLLGSTALVTRAGQAPRRFFYEPFGKRVARDGLTQRARDDVTHADFAGHENEDGLINMGGRIYDPSLRRFISPDPVIGTPLLTQGYAPYSYVLNRPLRLVDPTGFVPEDPIPPPPPPPGTCDNCPDRTGPGVVQGGNDDDAGRVRKGKRSQGRFRTDDPHRDREIVYGRNAQQRTPGATRAEGPTAGGGPLELEYEETVWEKPPGTSLFDPEVGALACGPATPACAAGAAAGARALLPTVIRVAPLVGVWLKGLADRGLAIEQRLGGNLPRAFPVIDQWKHGIAKSIKSIDLTAKTYQDIPRLGRVIERYIDRVAGFRGASFDGVVIKSSQIKGRALEVAIQPGVATPQQTNALKALSDYANKSGVDMRIIEIQ